MSDWGLGATGELVTAVVVAVVATTQVVGATEVATEGDNDGDGDSGDIEIFGVCNVVYVGVAGGAK